MTVKVSCPSCGKSYKAPPKLQGKAIKCPKCGAAIRIPAGDKPTSATQNAAQRKSAAPQPAAPQTQPQAAETPIVVSCPCGGRFQAPPSMAGQQTPCLNCGQTLTVPLPVSPALLQPTSKPAPQQPAPQQFQQPANDPLGLGPNSAAAGQDPFGLPGNDPFAASPNPLGAPANPLGTSKALNAYAAPKGAAPKRRRSGGKMPGTIKGVVIFQCILGGLGVLCGVGLPMLIFASRDKDGVPVAIGLLIFFLFSALINFGVAAMVAKRVPGAAILVTILGAMAVMNFPVGTAIGVFLLINIWKPESQQYLKG